MRALGRLATVLLALGAASCDKFTPPTLPPPATGPEPETTLTAGPAARTRSRNLRVTIGSNEATASFQCALDAEAFVPCAASHARDGLAAGVHVLRAFATLPDGRFDATPASLTWEIVTTPLDTTLTSAPPAMTASSGATFSFTGSEAGLTFECATDEGAFAACTSPLSLTSLTPGAHRFRVRAVDAEGNRDETPAEHRWTVDNVTPTVTIVTRPTGVVGESSFTFTFRTNKESARPFCQLDGAAAAPCTSPHTVSGLTPGTHQFSVYAIDEAGNRSTPDTAGFTVQWALGRSCAAATDCQSGFCRDGYCCNEACDGVCRSCALTRGSCRSVRNGPDPDSCGGSNSCDDNSQCAASTGGGSDTDLTSANYRFRGRFPGGDGESQSTRFRFSGELQTGP